MGPSTPFRPGRVAAAVLGLVMMTSLLPMATAYAISVSVTAATGGGAIPDDNFATANFTTLTGPTITENGAGILAINKTIVLNVPAGFVFNPAVGNVSISGTSCDLIVSALTMTTTTATLTINQASTVNTCVLTYIGLQVQPSSGSLSSGTITNSGTAIAPNPGNYGMLAEVPGNVNSFVISPQPGSPTTGGVAFTTQPQAIALDQFTHGVPNAPVVLSITPGTGPSGAVLTCTNPSNTSTTDGGGGTTFAGCKIDKAGTYTLRFSSNGKTADTGTLVVTVGPASKLVFTSYPAAATPQLLTPQPAVAVTDLGGNVIVTETRLITIAINQNGGTFSCTGGLALAAVAGVATFTGCNQTTTASGYALTATASPVLTTVTGPLFAVAALKLTFIVQPGSTTANTAFSPDVKVAIQDAGGTTLTGSSATISLTIGTNPSGGTLTCTGGNSVATVNGVATFTGCSINNPGAGYTLTATATTVPPAIPPTAATSTPFNIGAPVPAAMISITTFCGTPPVSLSGGNTCAPDTSKSPPQANIKLPQTLDEGVRLQAQFSVSGANRSVIFEVSKDQITWTAIATITSDSSGAASTFYRPSDNRFYRARFAGATDLGPGTSSVVRVVVRSLIFIRPTGCTSTSMCTRRHGTVATFVATARPNRPELPTQQVQFVVQRKSGGTWANFITQVVNVSKATGTASLTMTFSGVGTFRLRANLLPTPVNANSFPTEFEYYRIT